MARVFVAIPLSTDLQEQASLIEDKLAHLPVRWLTGKNLHITLVPPWEEPDTFAAIKLLDNLQGLGTFDIKLDHIALGPQPREPRLIWTRGQAPQELLDLKAAAEKVFGKTSEQRLYRLHATLARFRSENYDENIFKDVPRTIRWKQKVESVVLMKSKLSNQGADYEILGKIDL